MGSNKWSNKVVKPLERILLDNGIIRAGSNSSPRHRSDETIKSAYVDVEEDADQMESEYVCSSSSSSSSSPRPRSSKLERTNSSSSNSSMYLNSSSNNSSNRDGQYGYGTSSIATANSSAKTSYNPDYWSAAATSSALPARQNFCSVCGYIGNYSCVRCGSRFCSIKCNTNHKETRCLKFSC